MIVVSGSGGQDRVPQDVHPVPVGSAAGEVAGTIAGDYAAGGEGSPVVDTAVIDRWETEYQGGEVIGVFIDVGGGGVGGPAAAAA